MSVTPFHLSQDRPLVGVVLKMPNPAMVEMAAHCGAHLVIIDTEHGAGGDVELEHHVRAGDAAGIPVIVRVPANEPAFIQAALDAGARGVVVPHIGSAKQARAAVDLAHYPPFGSRGLALTTRAGLQGSADLEPTLVRAAEQTIVICQIEDPEGVRAVGDILAVERVSGVWIGTNDLSMSLRDADGVVPGGSVEAAVEAVTSAVASSSVALAMLAAGPAATLAWRQRGADILLVTIHDLINSSLRSYVEDVDSLDGRLAEET